jgi:hypothetical protein
LAISTSLRRHNIRIGEGTTLNEFHAATRSSLSDLRATIFNASSGKDAEALLLRPTAPSPETFHFWPRIVFTKARHNSRACYVNTEGLEADWARQ